MWKRRSRVVVITGASAGVGRAAVREFARDGADIGLIARNREALEIVRAEVEQLGRRAIAVTSLTRDTRSRLVSARRPRR